MTNPTDIAFSSSVKAAQARKGSREIYENMRMGEEIDFRLAATIANIRSCYLASASEDGQPYIQHRGGPPGFLHVLDKKRLAFADFGGNKQYISTGNFDENPKAYIFIMDYAEQRRFKLWGEVEIHGKDHELANWLMPQGYGARLEQVMIFTVKAWDMNCPQHIPQMFHAEDVNTALKRHRERIAELEAELSALRGA
jgi:predicted pyridoxine 5'-phosphate oxidase superfamily flavin-nucleotide-binding protein